MSGEWTSFVLYPLENGKNGDILYFARINARPKEHTGECSFADHFLRQRKYPDPGSGLAARKSL